MDKYKLAKKVDPTVPKERWVASLSNGETVYENNLDGERPAWVRLGDYCRDKGLYITGLRLQIAGTEIKLPSGQEGYLQKKVAWSNMSNGGIRKAIGYVQGGLALIHEADSSRDSRTIRTTDPGEPWVIYKESPYAIAE